MKLLDLTDPERSDIRYKRMTFPDGQPHFELTSDELPHLEPVEILCRVKSAADIADVGMALDTLLSASLAHDRVPLSIALNVAYMLGARMDRRIGPGRPHTLDVLASMLAVAANGVDRIRVLDPHSPATLKAFLREGFTTEAIEPDRLVKLALQHYAIYNATIVVPDEGAVARTGAIVERLGLTNPVARCVKQRDSATGKLSGFALVDGDVKGRACLIVDDLCDGGGTFSGIAAVLRAAGAATVGLCVTHGILSKGPTIKGVDVIYTTDSFQPFETVWGLVPIKGRCGFRSLVRPDDERALVHVLPDFLRQHVQESHGGGGSTPPA